MVVAATVSAVDHLAVNFDDGAPSSGLGSLIGITGEVEFARLAEVLQPLAGSAAVLTDGEVLIGLHVLDGSSVTIIEVLNVRVKLRGNHVDLALDCLVDGNHLIVQSTLGVTDSKVSGANELSVVNALLNLEQQLAVIALGDGDDLGVSLVGVRIKLEDGATPRWVVDSSSSNFSSHS